MVCIALQSDIENLLHNVCEMGMFLFVRVTNIWFALIGDGYSMSLRLGRLAQCKYARKDITIYISPIVRCAKYLGWQYVPHESHMKIVCTYNILTVNFWLFPWQMYWLNVISCCLLDGMSLLCRRLTFNSLFCNFIFSYASSIYLYNVLTSMKFLPKKYIYS